MLLYWYPSLSTPNTENKILFGSGRLRPNQSCEEEAGKLQNSQAKSSINDVASSSCGYPVYHGDRALCLD